MLRSARVHLFNSFNHFSPSFIQRAADECAHRAAVVADASKGCATHTHAAAAATRSANRIRRDAVAVEKECASLYTTVQTKEKEWVLARGKVAAFKAQQVRSAKQKQKQKQKQQNISDFTFFAFVVSIAITV
jgi:hypothetical protein